MLQRSLQIAAALLLALSTVLVVDALAPSNNLKGRRAFVELVVAGGSVATFGAAASPAMAAQDPELRQGNEVTAFNGLAFNYRGGEYGGLDASSLDELTVSYKDFNEKLKAGEVVFVEFFAPDGDVAYATFKDDDKKIRIGEGYPIEQHDGYSSPMFCIRAVKNAGVPYKFTVKGLAKYSQ
jgi:hypothetical protein